MCEGLVENVRYIYRRFEFDNHDGISSQGRCVATLALLCSDDDSKALRVVGPMALDWTKPYSKTTWSWHLGFQAITLAKAESVSVSPKLYDVRGKLLR